MRCATWSVRVAAGGCAVLGLRSGDPVTRFRTSDAEIAATQPHGHADRSGKDLDRALRTVHKITAMATRLASGSPMPDAAARLGVSHVKIRRFIRDGPSPAEQVMRGAPYQIRASDLEDERFKADL